MEPGSFPEGFAKLFCNRGIGSPDRSAGPHTGYHGAMPKDADDTRGMGGPPKRAQTDLLRMGFGRGCRSISAVC